VASKSLSSLAASFDSARQVRIPTNSATATIVISKPIAGARPVKANEATVQTIVQTNPKAMLFLIPVRWRLETGRLGRWGGDNQEVMSDENSLEGEETTSRKSAIDGIEGLPQRGQRHSGLSSAWAFEFMDADFFWISSTDLIV
jgi:hypothetical protein